jgi:hypothetical protein
VHDHVGFKEKRKHSRQEDALLFNPSVSRFDHLVNVPARTVDLPSVPTATPELHDSHCDHLSANVAPLVEEKPVCDLGLLLPLLDALHIRFPTITHSEIRRVLERTVASVLADPLVADVLVRHSSAHLQSNMDMP